MHPATEARVARILSRCSSALTAGQLAALSEIVEYELRQQADDTRRACVDAVLSVRDDDVLFSSQCAIDRAHKAVLDVPLV